MYCYLCSLVNDSDITLLLEHEAAKCFQREFILSRLVTYTDIDAVDAIYKRL